MSTRVNHLELSETRWHSKSNSCIQAVCMHKFLPGIARLLKPKNAAIGFLHFHFPTLEVQKM